MFLILKNIIATVQFFSQSNAFGCFYNKICFQNNDTLELVITFDKTQTDA